MPGEMQSLWAALVVYTLAGSTSIIGVVLRRLPERTILGLVLGGLALHSFSLGIRWERLGHGPFITMFEILSSNIWSLILVFVVVYWRIPRIRPMAAVVMPILFVMMGWLLMQSPRDGHFPPTYKTVWLFIHVGLGKVFLGATLIAVGLGGIVLARANAHAGRWFAGLPADDRLDELAYRFLAIGLIFETLMLVAGAIWAQDAWGRYWAWDPLETWAFLTWLLLVFTLHLRVQVRPSPRISSALALGVFVLAFLTFFGIPFVSTAPHKGAI